MAAFAPALGQNLRSRPPRNPNGQKNDSTRQLEFTAAMKDFKNMFPDMDDEVIEAVLRSNNGLVDATIDQLLSMGAGNEPKDDFPHLPSYTDTGLSDPPPAYSPRETEISDGRPLPARPYSAWHPPLLGTLPEDFLRFTRLPTSNDNTSLSVSPSLTTGRDNDRKHEQFLEDEKLAQVLQNEEFVRELTRNTDFMMSLERDKQRNMTLNDANTSASETPPVPNTSSLKSADVPSTGNSGSRYNHQDLSSFGAGSTAANDNHQDLSSLGAGNSGARYNLQSSSLGVENTASSDNHQDLSTLGAVGGPPQHEDAVFREKLKHMGKSTRKKLDKMARIFHRKKNTQRANLMVGGSTSTANLLEEYEEDDDDELLNVMASGRLEIMNEGEDENERNADSMDSNHSNNHPQARVYDPFDPVDFYAEDNEFEYKNEK